MQMTPGVRSQKYLYYQVCLKGQKLFDLTTGASSAEESTDMLISLILFHPLLRLFHNCFTLF